MAEKAGNLIRRDKTHVFWSNSRRRSKQSGQLLHHCRIGRADIPALVQYFMLKKTREMGFVEVPTLAPGAIEKLMNYDWPGNVRELQNAVERALILNRKRPLSFDNIGYTLPRANAIITSTEAENSLSFEQATSQTIIKALKMAGGRIEGEKGAAKLLKINPSTLRTKMRKLGIPFGRKGSV